MEFDNSGHGNNATELLEDAEFIEQTEKAILIEIDDGGTEPQIGVNRFWIPKSVIVESDLEEYGDIGDISVKLWWFEQCDGLEEAIS